MVLNFLGIFGYGVVFIWYRFKFFYVSKNCFFINIFFGIFILFGIDLIINFFYFSYWGKNVCVVFIESFDFMILE